MVHFHSSFVVEPCSGRRSSHNLVGFLMDNLRSNFENSSDGVGTQYSMSKTPPSTLE